MSSSSSDKATAATAETTAASAATAAATAAATKQKKKTKKKKAEGRLKAKAPRLEGEALRDELMRREKREEARVLAVNTLFYRARAYNVSAHRARATVVCHPTLVWLLCVASV